jgi:hypothetical protein
MGKVLNYKDYLEHLEKELNNFEAELGQVAEENGITFEEVLALLDAYEAEYYELLIKRIVQLNRWGATEQLFGAYRQAERVMA